MRKKMFVLIVVLALAAASCGGSGGVDTGSGETVSTFDLVLGGDTAARLTRANDFESAALAKTQACMQEAGFDFTVHQQSPGRQPLAALLEDLTVEEVAESFGYGLVATIDDQLQAAVTDPNIEYQRSLAPAARDEFERALYGATFDELQNGVAPGRDSCQLAGVDRSSAVFTLQEGLIELESDLRRDTEMQKLEEEWRQCMRGEGLEATGWDWGRQAVQQRIQSFVVSLTLKLDDGSEVSYLENQSLLLNDASVELVTDQDLLGSIQAEEITIAQSDLTCRTEIDAELRQIEDTYHDTFEEANTELLRRVASELSLE